MYRIALFYFYILHINTYLQELNDDVQKSSGNIEDAV